MYDRAMKNGELAKILTDVFFLSL